jgi:hypothetical protein
MRGEAERNRADNLQYSGENRKYNPTKIGEKRIHCEQRAIGHSRARGAAVIILTLRSNVEGCATRDRKRVTHYAGILKFAINPFSTLKNGIPTIE